MQHSYQDQQMMLVDDENAQKLLTSKCENLDPDGLNDSNSSPEITQMTSTIVMDPRPHSMSLSIMHLDAEKVLDKMGKYGKYQMMIYAMSNLGYFLFACETLIMSLIAPTTEFECQLTEIGLNDTWECGRGPESKFNYFNTNNRTNLVTEFDLVCSQEYWSQHGTSLFMIGGMITTPLLIQLADRYGRRFTFLIPLWLTVIANIACAASPSYFYFLFFRFVAGLNTAGIGTVGFVMMIEGVAPSFRSITPLFSTFVWVGGYMSVGIFHLFLYNWRWLYFAVSMPGFLSILFYWFMPESLYWLITNNKTKQVKRYIKHSSKMNKREIVIHECYSDLALSEQASIEANGSTNIQKREIGGRSFIDMFKSGSLLFHVILHSFVMITMNFTYWALSLFSGELHEDEMTGYFLSGAVELPAGFISIFLLIYFGRKNVTFCALIAQSIMMFFSVLYPGKSYFSMMFPLLAKTFNSVVWTSEPILLSEMSPTSLRNSFYGFVGFAGEIGSILAPYLNILKQFHESAPSVLICIMSLTSGLAVLCSPETKNKSMPQDIDDFDAGPVFKFLFMGSIHNQPQKQENNALQSQEKNLLLDSKANESNQIATDVIASEIA